MVIAAAMSGVHGVGVECRKEVVRERKEQCAMAACLSSLGGLPDFHNGVGLRTDGTGRICLRTPPGTGKNCAPI